MLIVYYFLKLLFVVHILYIKYLLVHIIIVVPIDSNHGFLLNLSDRIRNYFNNFSDTKIKNLVYVFTSPRRLYIHFYANVLLLCNASI